MKADWLIQRPIAHRGLHNLGDGIPENSLSAFELAARRGFPVELDVRALSDGSPVVFHDISLERSTGESGSISEHDRVSVKRLRLGGTSETIPLLDDVLQAVAGRTPILIEIKNEARPGRLERGVLDALNAYDGEFGVQSFSPWSLSWFYAQAPGIPRGQIVGDLKGGTPGHAAFERILLLNLMLNHVSRPDFVSCDKRFLTRRALRRSRENGLPTLSWTVRSEEEEWLTRNYCDNIIFEGYLPSLEARRL